jgi:hypothetical protein
MNANADTEILRLWQQQTSEEHMMPLDEIRTKAERLDTNTRRWRAVTAVLFLCGDHGSLAGVERRGDAGKGRRSADHCSVRVCRVPLS